jgi:PAS domain S-box-containing protein
MHFMALMLCVGLGGVLLGLALHRLWLARSGRGGMEADAGQLQEFMASPPVAMAALDAEGRVIHWNAAMERLTGHPMNDASGRTLADLLGDGSTSSSLFAACDQAVDHTIKTRLRKADGAVLPVDVSVTPSNGPAGACRIALMRDMRLRNQHEDELRQLRQEQLVAIQSMREQLDFQELLIDAIPNPIFIKDVQGRYLSVNRAFEEAYGITRDELHGRTVLEAGRLDLQPAEREALHEEELRLIRDGEIVHGQNDAPWADGQQHQELSWRRGIVRKDGQAAGLVGVIIDISAQMQAQRTLADREKETRNLLDSSPAALIVISPVTKLPAFVNKNVLQIFRMEEDDFRANGLNGRYVDPGAREAQFVAMKRDGKVDGMDLEVIRGDGVRIWVQVVGRIGLYKNEPALFGWYADITQRRQEAIALQQARDAAEAATASKSAFLANMSHEIRTPMNAIIGLTHLALRTTLDAQQRDYITKAHGAGQALLGILNDILDFSKIEADRLELEAVDFDLDETLSRVTTVTGGKVWEKDLELLLEVPPDVPRWLCSDPLRLSQVLTNLINNAVKFTERGQILVRCHHVPLPEGRLELQVQVQDTGIGMTPEQMERMFKAFSQADGSTTRKFGGTGLGLSISKRLVEMAGGTIGVDSTPGVGSVFHFTWPCDAATTPPPAARALPEELRGMRVLVVDDNAAARDILGEALKPFGFEVDMFASGEEAWEAHETVATSHPYKLVLTDWKMPGMDGLELTRRIKAGASGQPVPSVVLVTAFGREEAHHEARRAKADALMVKPINQSQLVDTLMGLYAREVTAAFNLGDESPQLHGLRVLLTEDNEINQQIAVELMASAGVDVDVAANGAIAIAKLDAAEPDRYHLVFMDLQMPVMDGHQATLAIRANPRYTHLPIIAMTAHAMVEERQRCIAEGMNDHITKPIDPAMLYRALQKWGGEHIVAASVEAAPVPSGASNDAFDLESLRPMLDLDAALRRVAGNKKLYADLLRRYRSDQHDFAERLRALLAGGDLGAVERAAHTLKGVSANIGAEAAADASGALEHALNQHGDAAELEHLIGATQASLGPLLAALDHWLAAQGVASARAAPPTTPASAQALRADLLHLCHLLDQTDGETEEWLQRIYPQAATQLSLNYWTLWRARCATSISMKLRCCCASIHFCEGRLLPGCDVLTAEWGGRDDTSANFEAEPPNPNRVRPFDRLRTIGCFHKLSKTGGGGRTCPIPEAPRIWLRQSAGVAPCKPVLSLSKGGGYTK